MLKFISTILLFSCLLKLSGQYSVFSPDGKLEVKLQISNNHLKYSLLKEEEVLISPSSLGLESNVFKVADFNKVVKTAITSGRDIYKPYWGPTNQIDESYNQLTVQFQNHVSLEIRAYNSGVAWRFVTDVNGKLFVYNELCEFNSSRNSTVYFPEAKGFSTPFEANFLPTKLIMVQGEKLGLTPLLIKSTSGKSMVIGEVNLKNYPGMFVKLDSLGMRATFPKYPLAEKEQLPGRLRLLNIPQLSKLMVRKTADYIAKCEGVRSFPWRMILVASSDKELLTNNLVAALAEKPQNSEDYSWVKPGKVVWDWYHNWKFDGVDFKSGINTATYKYMIDFAAKNNFQYINIDDGWSALHNFEKVNKHLDLKEVIDYAKSKEVGVFLWCTWQTLEKELETNLDNFQKLGVAGLKVDFFDRCDQRVVDFVNTLGKECAKRKLLLNLHGMYKPTGLQISWPNMVNFEGVLGLEYNKFSEKCTPVHNVTIPFVRNAVGPMDYTPGAMCYLDSTEFEKSWKNPHAMTTKAHQMAMYVVYHGGIQMLSDSPIFYEQDSVALSFLKDVPVSWDESIALNSKIGEYAVVARRKGQDWYFAGINSNTSRELTVDPCFVDLQDYSLILYTDGSEKGELVQIENPPITESGIHVKISPAGGFILKLVKQ